MKNLSKSGALDSSLVARIGHYSAGFETGAERQNGHLVRDWQKGVKRAYFDRSLARK